MDISEIKERYNLIVILGPTASGKTKLAVELADFLSTEIISADSRQVYKGMDIGTGKDLSEYNFNGRNIPYHLIDIEEAGCKYDVSRYQKDFFSAYENVNNRGKIPVLCGGTGLYIESVLGDMTFTNIPPNLTLKDQLSDLTKSALMDYVQKIPNPNGIAFDFNSKKRMIRAAEILTFLQKNELPQSPFPVLKPYIIGIDIPREQRRAKISSRLQQRLEGGMVEEVEQLIAKGVTMEELEYYGLEYKYLSWFLAGKLSFEEMYAQLEVAIHQYAKRQMTWFRGMGKRGFDIAWVSYNLAEENKRELFSFIQRVL